MKRYGAYLCASVAIGLVFACRHLKPEESAPRNPAVKKIPGRPDIEANADRMVDEGRKVFRHDTFGSQDYWGDKLRLHEAISGAERHGVGPGLTPHQALERGLKVDSDAVPKVLMQVLKGGSVSLDKEKTTIELLKADKFYRTTPLKGLFVREKGGFYHDGRFATYADVIAHYERLLKLNLTPQEETDLIQFLKSL
jgi:hypothetical protein